MCTGQAVMQVGQGSSAFFTIELVGVRVQHACRVARDSQQSCLAWAIHLDDLLPATVIVSLGVHDHAAYTTLF